MAVTAVVAVEAAVVVVRAAGVGAVEADVEAAAEVGAVGAGVGVRKLSFYPRCV